MGLVLGANVSVIYSGGSEANQQQKRRPSLLPLLVVLFMASYGILVMLVVEQGRTIESQRGLLRDLLKDSTQLAQLKVKIAREARHATPDAPAAKAPEQKDTPESATPSAPKAQQHSQLQGRTKAPHAMKDVPSKPAQDLNDVRRSTKQS